MPLWETYALLLALQLWIGQIVKDRASLLIKGDAQGMLKAVITRRARNPALNLAIAEINLVLAPCNFELQAEHIWSEHNDVADALSRISEGAALPERCHNATRDMIRNRRYAFLGKAIGNL